MVTDAPVKHFLADIDGTTFPDRQNGESLPDGFYGALARLSRIIERGNKGDLPPFGFCTGRELTYVQVITRALPLPDGWSIIENGLCLYNLATEERINHPLFTPETAVAFRNIRDRIGTVTHRFPDLEVYLEKEVHVALERCNRWINLAEYVAPIEEMFFDFREQMDVVCSGHAIDILIKGINKGSGLQELCKWSGISPEEILVIGDSPNDIPAMRLAGYVGCPSNADEECKEFVRNKGGHVSSFPYVVGVVDIIRHYLPSAGQA